MNENDKIFINQLCIELNYSKRAYNTKLNLNHNNLITLRDW